MSGWKWSLNVSAQRTTRRPSCTRAPRFANHARNVSGANGGIRASAADAGRELCDRARTRKLRDEVGEPGRDRTEPCPLVDQAERVRVARAEALLVEVREELGLERRDVDVYRAVTFAALAREAESSASFTFSSCHTFVIGPSVRIISSRRLRSTARRVLFLARDHEARTHHVVVGIAPRRSRAGTCRHRRSVRSRA